MELHGLQLINDDFFKLAVRFVLNGFFVSLLVFSVYYPHQRRKNYVFTYLMLNIMIFLICFSLQKLNLGIGMALGLFAVFAIIRYRTDAIRIKEMTYLFVIVGMAVINSLSNGSTSYAELFLSNGLIIVVAWVMEKTFMISRKLRQQVINYDKLELLKPDHREELLTDLRARTGLHILRVSVKRIDLRSQSATIMAYWQGPEDAGDSDESSDDDAT